MVTWVMPPIAISISASSRGRAGSIPGRAARAPSSATTSMPATTATAATISYGVGHPAIIICFPRFEYFDISASHVSFVLAHSNVDLCGVRENDKGFSRGTATSVSQQYVYGVQSLYEYERKYKLEYWWYLMVVEALYLPILSLSPRPPTSPPIQLSSKNAPFFPIILFQYYIAIETAN